MIAKSRAEDGGVSTTAIGSPNATGTVMSVLVQASANAATLNANVEINQINNLIQNRLTDQIAALQNTPDNAMTGPAQAQVTALTTQASAMKATASQYGANANTMFDLQNQLAALQTAAANGDSAAFDATLLLANNDVSDLNIGTPIPPLQPDGVANLKSAGLGIGASATYDLSTPSGQAAAAAAIQNAQILVGNVSQVTSSNQLIANSANQALTNEVSALNSQLQQVQQNTDAATNAKIAQLTQQAQAQEHLIELAIGNTQLVSTALTQAENPPQTATSPFDVLSNAVGATPATYQATQSTPAILSLLT
jgi:hypothetical protein